MPKDLLLVAIFSTAYLSFALFALSQVRHWRVVFDKALPTQREVLLLRSLGILMLSISLALSLVRDGASFGSLLWITMIGVAALAVALTLAWRPRWLRPASKLFSFTYPDTGRVNHKMNQVKG
ncbi:hypothetical protein Sbal183_0101 [Shewanella baltica OS183]|uniref:DUF3325 domain-containing protein n=1 Tax=Shewanella baltica TaxID=62322 RepID=UPI0001E10930|nr:DUF3325 domain-containing protein [Shewanella baltica]AEG13411.1 hypothetical protein Sbal175_4191 [Shewanella baltica BA175]EHQ13043.1 hypothetical protein Sbal183_0101 [Shewanella baltica OS183]